MNDVVVINTYLGEYDSFVFYSIPVNPSDQVFQTDENGCFIDLEDLADGDTYNEYEICICNTLEEALNELDEIDNQDFFMTSVSIIELEQRGNAYYPLRIVA